MAEVTITREDSPTKGRYVARVAGIDGEGELTFSKVNPQLIIADHTFVPDAFRGMGVARALAEYANEEPSTAPAAPEAPASLPLPLAQPLSAAPAPGGFKIGDICPECGEASLVNEEGCRKCYSCGFSQW